MSDDATVERNERIKASMRQKEGFLTGPKKAQTFVIH